MGMKKSAQLLGFMATVAALSGESINFPEERQRILTDEEIEKARKRKEQLNKEKQLKNLKENQGLKEYYYGEEVIYARNQKNADRKARNKGYIK